MPLIQLHAQVVLVLHSAVEAFGPFAFDAQLFALKTGCS